MRISYWGTATAVGVCMIGCSSLDDRSAAVTAAPAALDAVACSPESPGIPIAPGVLYYDCSSSEPAVHIVTVDRSLPATEIQLIADRRSDDPPGKLRLKRVKDLAAGVDAIDVRHRHECAGWRCVSAERNQR